jgi:gallate dioxygenase
MRGAMSSRIECMHRDYYLPSMTGIAVAVYENADADDSDMRAARAQRQREPLRRDLLPAANPD